MGFQAVPEALRAARRAAADAVAELRGIDCGEPVCTLTTAMPGGTTAATAPSSGGAWTTAFISWCTDAEIHADGLATAADRYQRTDHAGGDELEAAGALHGPR
ncbi:hypothetical protein AB0M83_36725 [Amycolatopsis sp. NPDC051106]|uniref:hypothetical protein n=1 Tax=unclassified Amycolatopsis TaxID=2618356 RepID=UPI0034176B91